MPEKDTAPAEPKVVDTPETKPKVAKPKQSAEPAVAKKAPAKPAAKAKTKPTKAADKAASGSEKSREAVKRGKRYAAAAELIDRERAYPLEEAVELAKQTATTKFDATIEIHFRMGLDPRNADQNIRGTVKLPAGTGKAVRVMAFVPEAKFAEAKKAGADFVSDEATLKKIKDGWTEFDVAVATPDQMAEVGKLGQALGPKGLMPNPKAGTVSAKPAEAIAEVKKGTIEFRLAKDATIHAGIGKASFSASDLTANITAYIQAIRAVKPSDLKGTYLRSITLAATMGPGIRVDAASIGRKESV